MAATPAAALRAKRAGAWGPVLAGAAVSLLGGLIGLGGAEFRLPLLIGVFGFAALQAVVLNKAMSLIVILEALPARLAGSLSLAVSLPTMLVAFARYSRDGSFAVLGENRQFVGLMAAGSVAGTVAGGLAVGVVPQSVLVPLLRAVLLMSSGQVWAHR